MAKSVKINGVTYPDVPYVNIPLSTGSGNAKFVDTDSGDAVATDIRVGKVAWVDGDEVTGTVAERTSADLTASGATVTAPAGIYDTAATKTIASGTVTPTATVTGDELGTTVSDYPVEVTPAATVSAGYVSGDKTGTKITKYIQTETKTVTSSASAQEVTPTSGKLLSKVTVNAIPESSVTSDIISGRAIEEATGDYAWESTVTLPAGYHTAQTLTKTFSEVFPAPETPATNAQIRLGYQAYNKSGVLMTGTMPENGAATITLAHQNQQYIIPQGYHSGEGIVKAVIDDADVSAEATLTGGVIDTTVSDYPVVATPKIGVSDAGYIEDDVTGTAVTKYVQVETKTATPSTSSQTISPSTGKLLSSVTVNAIPKRYGDTTDCGYDPSQILDGCFYLGNDGCADPSSVKYEGTMPNNGAVSVTLDTATTSYTVPLGYHNGSGTVSISTQTKTATPSVSAQTITPDSGKVLSSVTVTAVDMTATATESDVMNGKTFFSGSLTRRTGTATVPTVSQDSTTKVLTIS